MSHHDHSLEVRGVPHARQVVVRFKSSEPVRRSLSMLASTHAADAPAASSGPLEALLRNAQITSIEPLFERERDGARLAKSNRLLLSLEEDDDLSGFHVLTFDSVERAQAAVAKLKRDKRIELVHLIPDRHFCAAQKASSSRPKKAPRSGIDPQLNRQWGLVAIKLPEAQAIAKFQEATDIVVAVIDSGVDATHPDLKGIFLEEKNFTSGSKKDTQGHGTHVSGIIAAIRNNKLGISGVCQSRKIMALKALGPYSGPGYYRALRYATDQGARVINLSMGGEHDPTEELLIKRAIAKNVVVVAAMGNEYEEGNATSYPAAISGVIAVGATDELDRRASFSNTGPHIALVAPGVNVLSTVPTYPTSLAEGTDYEAWPGTSMATPFVAAAVALLLAKNPALTVAQITKALQKGADKPSGQLRFNHELGHGRLNILKSLALV